MFYTTFCLLRSVQSLWLYTYLKSIEFMFFINIVLRKKAYFVTKYFFLWYLHVLSFKLKEQKKLIKEDMNFYLIDNKDLVFSCNFICLALEHFFLNLINESFYKISFLSYKRITTSIRAKLWNGRTNKH